MFKIRNNNKNLAIVILIGGKSTRFGSDKGLFEINGKTLLTHQLETLSQLNYKIFIVANSIKQVNKYIEKINYKVVTAFIIDEKDIISKKDINTPMLGLYSAFKELNRLKYDKAFTLSCDTPLIKKEVIKYLIKESKDFDCCIPQWNNGFLEPLFAVYPVQKAYIKAKESLINKTYKLINLLDNNWKINYVSIENSIIPFDKDLTSFININESADLQKLIDIL
ncbi:MAG: molybdenum cofactor guanylyltransferase [Promethearchaeota archaeon]